MFTESLREKAVESLFAMNTFNDSMNIWRGAIASYKQQHSSYSYQSLVDISTNLRSIFKQTGQSGRSQGSVSGGGAAWEGLVCWYLNLCLLSTNCVVIKQNKDLIPDPIRKALTVMYGSSPSNTESDLVAITFPEDINNELDSNSTKAEIDQYCTEHFNEMELCVIQCKTNWNDNAQIPMLWDIIYNSVGGIQTATVGIEGYTVSALSRFTYAFVTVPSQNNLNSFKSTATAILRVERLSGGNYWGLASKNGVALTLQAMLTKNFTTALLSMSGGWHAAINLELLKVNSVYSYFRLA